eukprot:1357359-Rhodomonas_salina.2
MLADAGLLDLGAASHAQRLTYAVPACLRCSCSVSVWCRRACVGVWCWHRLRGVFVMLMQGVSVCVCGAKGAVYARGGLQATA